MANANQRAEKTYWVVAADESQAEIYTRDTRHAPLRKLFSLENEARRMKTGDLVSDSGGRSFDSFGKGRHTMAKEKSGPKKHIAEVFAKHIAERIGAVIHDGSCRGYALIAAPRFLGLLRAALSTTCKVEPFKTIDKELVGQDAAVLQKLVDGD